MIHYQFDTTMRGQGCLLGKQPRSRAQAKTTRVLYEAGVEGSLSLEMGNEAQVLGDVGAAWLWDNGCIIIPRGLLIQKGSNKPALTAHTYNLSTQSVEAKGSGVCGQPGHSKKPMAWI